MSSNDILNLPDSELNIIDLTDMSNLSIQQRSFDSGTSNSSSIARSELVLSRSCDER